VTPLKVVFHLSTPIALGFPWISFDSLLAHVKLKEELGERYYSLPSKTPVREISEIKLESGEIPLKKWRDLYVASVSLFEPSNVEAYVLITLNAGTSRSREAGLGVGAASSRTST
jgi:hypothetical protein